MKLAAFGSFQTTVWKFEGEEAAGFSMPWVYWIRQEVLVGGVAVVDMALNPETPERPELHKKHANTHEQTDTHILHIISHYIVHSYIILKKSLMQIQQNLNSLKMYLESM